ncbi:hypothetical protein GPECTOR_1g339 [Gonium pectorale]|uniref:Uncharacterized protein n=1 Tax=Gonium pectorale TaxID=33097 RepID=A0A150H316_GONPE|nr:hypothetical protein GPECTOR_1g339 [Gonium pectorale]|eukprot:KXZ56382.1 hypothetical protein GPECTOR_1g339 [Gonium pectorale]
MAAQAESLRPVLRAGELTMWTPGKAERRMSVDAGSASSGAAVHINDALVAAADKLPALRARMEEVSKRMSNVLQAIQEQKTLGRMQPTPLRSITPAKRAAEPDSIVGIIARGAQ